MIIHMTTVHPRDDSRILHKEIRTLARKTGETVAMFVQDGEGDAVDERNHCIIIDTGPALPRLKRMTLGAWRMIRAVRTAQPKLVIFHDPELIPWAPLLQLAGIKVIYDVHENYPGQIGRNPRLPKVLRPALSRITWLIERIYSRIFTGIIAVDPTVAAPFPQHKTVVVRNYPIVSELLSPTPRKMTERPKHFSYVGTISEDRNLLAMTECVHALGDPEARLRLAGNFVVPGLEEQVRATPAWQSVIYEGWLSREGVRDLLAETRAGLLLIKPIAHEMTGMPIKMCEYMAAGIPLIASNFPLWKEIIEGAGAGLTVDPLDKAAITEAMRWIIENPEEATIMGQRGRQAVLEKYNWDNQEGELLRIVQQSLGSRFRAPS